MSRCRRPAAPGARRRRCRGTALVELALAGPLLLLLVLVPFVADRWADRRLAALAAARHAAWEATVAPPARPAPGPAGVRVVLVRERGGLVRASATTERGDRDPAAGWWTPAGALPAPPPLSASLTLHVLPLEAGTEAAGRAAIERRWLGGSFAWPIRAALHGLLGEDPVRIDFDALPPREP